MIASTANAREVTGVTVDWEPYYGKKLKEGGMITKLVTKAFEASGHKFTLKFTPWKRALSSVEKGKDQEAGYC